MKTAAWILAAAACAISGAAQAAPSPAECQARANRSEAKLLECVQTDSLWKHLQKFQKIADANPGKRGHGNRDTGTSGYRASVDYVARLMRGAGYKVTIQNYPWRHFDLLERPSFRVDGGALPARDWFVTRLSGNGTVTAPLQTVGTANTASEIGCSHRDFRGFKRGNIALLMRSTCDFDVQVANAEAAGAAAVVIYNNRGEPTWGASRRAHNNGAAFQAKLTDVASIPVIGAISYKAGAALAERCSSGHAPQVKIEVHANTKSDIDYNVIADSPYGDRDRTVAIDAHLDSIYGAGILDNGSGSATILEIALNLAQTPTRNRLRYIWFGGEEIGLLGSRYYARMLPKKQLRKIAFDIDVDVTATPNFDVLIADPGHAHAVDKFPPNVVPASRVGNRAFTDYFRSAGITSRLASFGNDGTDSLSFSKVGVPNSGILTQQDCCKQKWEVALWGGYPGNYEGKVPGYNGGCVDNPHRWCDNLSNNDPFVFTFVTKAVAAVTLKLANHHF
jgi:hypothetical protein